MAAWGPFTSMGPLDALTRCNQGHNESRVTDPGGAGGRTFVVFPGRLHRFAGPDSHHVRAGRGRASHSQPAPRRCPRACRSACAAGWTQPPRRPCLLCSSRPWQRRRRIDLALQHGDHPGFSDLVRRGWIRADGVLQHPHGARRCAGRCPRPGGRCLSFPLPDTRPLAWPNTVPRE